MKKVIWITGLALAVLTLKYTGAGRMRVAQARKASAIIEHPAPDAALVEATVALADGKTSLLRPDYVRAQLDHWASDPALGHAFRAALADPVGIQTGAAALIRLLERRFIHDPAQSSLDLLPKPDRDKYVNFAWDKDDFPGGKPGPHEDVADAMVNALITVRPERRANSTDNAVAKKSEIMATGWDWVIAEEQAIPGQTRWKLNKYALASYVRMRDAAKRDGVDLFAVSANRDPRVAAANAARNGNPNAVASFSSHSLGLAVDFRMSDGKLNFDEVNTDDMPGLVRMRTSAVHKWLFLKGAKYGWYPYMQEPWHWEYNPLGFRETFWKAHGGVPVS